MFDVKIIVSDEGKKLIFTPIDELLRRMKQKAFYNFLVQKEFFKSIDSYFVSFTVSEDWYAAVFNSRYHNAKMLSRALTALRNNLKRAGWTFEYSWRLERGSTGTERLHYHMLFWTNCPQDEFKKKCQKYWPYQNYKCIPEDWFKRSDDSQHAEWYMTKYSGKNSVSSGTAECRFEMSARIYGFSRAFRRVPRCEHVVYDINDLHGGQANYSVKRKKNWRGFVDSVRNYKDIVGFKDVVDMGLYFANNDECDCGKHHFKNHALKPDLSRFASFSMVRKLKDIQPKILNQFGSLDIDETEELKRCEKITYRYRYVKTKKKVGSKTIFHPFEPEVNLDPYFETTPIWGADYFLVKEKQLASRRVRSTKHPPLPPPVCNEYQPYFRVKKHFYGPWTTDRLRFDHPFWCEKFVYKDIPAKDFYESRKFNKHPPSDHIVWLPKQKIHNHPYELDEDTKTNLEMVDWVDQQPDWYRSQFDELSEIPNKVFFA